MLSRETKTTQMIHWLSTGGLAHAVAFGCHQGLLQRLAALRLSHMLHCSGRWYIRVQETDTRVCVCIFLLFKSFFVSFFFFFSCNGLWMWLLDSYPWGWILNRCRKSNSEKCGDHRYRGTESLPIFQVSIIFWTRCLVWTRLVSLFNYDWVPVHLVLKSNKPVMKFMLFAVLHLQAALQLWPEVEKGTLFPRVHISS